MNDIHPNAVTAVTARVLDICTPDCFLGCGRSSGCYEVLAVHVDRPLSWRDLYRRAVAEFHASSGWFDDVAGSGTLVEDAMRNIFGASAVGDVEEIAPMTRCADCDDEDAEMVYCYIGLFPKTDA